MPCDCPPIFEVLYLVTDLLQLSLDHPLTRPRVMLPDVCFYRLACLHHCCAPQMSNAASRNGTLYQCHVMQRRICYCLIYPCMGPTTQRCCASVLPLYFLRRWIRATSMSECMPGPMAVQILFGIGFSIVCTSATKSSLVRLRVVQNLL